MNKAIFRKRSIAVLVTTLAAVGAIAAYTTATASAQGRTIEGNFCLGVHLFCMSAGLDGQPAVEGYGVDGNGGICKAPPPTSRTPPAGPAYCVPSGTGLLRLRPGRTGSPSTTRSTITTSSSGAVRLDDALRP